MEFKTWLELQGCTVEVTQEDDGGGYVCLAVRLPIDPPGFPVAFDVTVTAH